MLCPVTFAYSVYITRMFIQVYLLILDFGLCLGEQPPMPSSIRPECTQHPAASSVQTRDLGCSPIPVQSDNLQPIPDQVPVQQSTCTSTQEPVQQSVHPDASPLESAEQPAPSPASSPVYRPFSPDSMISGLKVLEKLHNHPECPTAIWASLCSDGTSCLLEMPQWPSDGPKTFRYRCSTCWNPNLPGESDLQGRPAAINQINNAWKHLAGCRTGHITHLPTTNHKIKIRHSYFKQVLNTI